MSIAGRVARLEGATGTDGPCALCEQRGRYRPPERHGAGWREELVNTIEMNCPRCGAPFVINVVMVEREEAA